mgnify:FL=1
MKKVLVLSDSHGDVAAMERAAARERPDLILHLGDLCRDFDELRRRLPMTQAMQNVCGNCDGFTEVPDQRVLLVEGKRILMMHGHRYEVKLGYSRAMWAAREAEADILLCGHTHIALDRDLMGLHLMNPGSCRGSRGTYGVIELGEGESLFRIEENRAGA